MASYTLQVRDSELWYYLEANVALLKILLHRKPRGSSGDDLDADAPRAGSAQPVSCWHLHAFNAASSSRSLQTEARTEDAKSSAGTLQILQQCLLQCDYVMAVPFESLDVLLLGNTVQAGVVFVQTHGVSLACRRIREQAACVVLVTQAYHLASSV